MKINTAELRAFLQAAGRIKPSRLMPILNFIKFENGTITKSNGPEFVQYTCEFKGVFLVEERIISNFIAATKADEIEITWTAKRVIISDGSASVNSPNADVKDFGTIPEHADNWDPLEDKIMEAIGSCATLLSDEDTAQPATRHVFIGGGLVVGTDGNVGLLYDVPQTSRIMLAKGPAAILGRLGRAEYVSAGNYDFFRSGPLLLGFVKPELVTWYDFVTWKAPDGLPVFTLPKAELIAFCDMCNAASPAYGGPSKLTRTSAEMNDNDYEVQVHRNIPGIGADVDPIQFAPRWLGKLLRQVPGDTIAIHYAPKTIYLVGNEWQGLYQQLVF